MQYRTLDFALNEVEFIMEQFIEIVEGFEKVQRDKKKINGRFEKNCKVGSGRFSLEIICDDIKSDDWKILINTFSEMIVSSQSVLTIEFLKSIVKQNLN